MILAFIFIKIDESSRWQPQLILIIFAIPLFCEMITKIRNNVKINRKTPINTNFKKILKISYMILIILVLLFFLLPIYTQTLLKYHIEEYAQSKTAKTDLHKLTSEITRGYSDDANKTKAILRWFDRDSGHITNTFGKEHSLKIYPLHVYTSKPYICIRLIGHENPLWVLKSRCGACEEYAMFFMEMANATNLTVRSIHNHGENHNWDEILINGKWIVVDPVQVKLNDNKTGFNISQRFYEEDWSLNRSYIFALYPNGTTEDVTYRYTNVSNLTIITIGENKMTAPNVSIRILSDNNPKKKASDTEINSITDSEGRCEIKIGGGNYTITGAKRDDSSHLSAEATITLVENENNSTQLILKKDRLWWLRCPLPSSLILAFLIFSNLGLLIFTVSYIKTSNKIGRVNKNYDRINSPEDNHDRPDRRSKR
jgi:hypothetical protein